jgi:hypothetical protein
MADVARIQEKMDDDEYKNYKKAFGAAEQKKISAYV